MNQRFHEICGQSETAIIIICYVFRRFEFVFDIYHKFYSNQNFVRQKNVFFQFAFCILFRHELPLWEKAIFATLLDLLFNKNQQSVATASKIYANMIMIEMVLLGGNQIEATYFAYCNMK